MQTQQQEFDFMTDKAPAGKPTSTKELLKERFAALYPKKRLLAIQLNGFTHTVFFDNGRKTDKVTAESFSACAPEMKWGSAAVALFNGISHAGYQNNAQELVFVLPNDR